MTKKLNEMKIGECGTVCALSGTISNMEARLRALGFTVGARVTKTMESPLGDPSAYLVKGSVIALRGCDAAGILVTSEACNES